VARAVQSQDGTPETDVGAEVFGDGHPLDDPVGWVFDAQDGDVDTRCEPVVLGDNLVSIMHGDRGWMENGSIPPDHACPCLR
jgi:hypothetical protein